MKKHLLAATMVFSSLASFGAAYQINLQGLRQLAMGGSGTAWPWDASTIFYNPGGLSRLKHIQAYGSMSWIRPATAYGSFDGSTRSVDQTFNPFNFYVGGLLKENGRVGLGLGIYTPFGMGLKWDDNWTGRYMVQSIQLKSVFIQPTISYKFTERLSAGIGFIYATGSFDFQRALPVQDFNTGLDGRAMLSGSANGVGFNLGVQYKASDNLQFGITYRSQVNMNMGGGSAKFAVPSSLRDSFPNTRFESSLPLPQVLSVGIGARPHERLTLTLDLNFTGWSSYDTLRINFADHTTALQDMRAPRRYRNTITTRIGANYKISKVVSVMGGAAYDPSPVPTNVVAPDLPDANRIVITFGAAIKPISRLTLLAACEMLSTGKRNGYYEYGNFSGTYKTQAVTPGIGVYYNF